MVGVGLFYGGGRPSGVGGSGRRGGVITGGG